MVLMPDPMTLHELQRCHPAAIARVVASIRIAADSWSDRWHLGGYAKDPGWMALFVGWHYAVGVISNDYTLIVDRAIAHAAYPALFAATATRESASWALLARLRFHDDDIEDGVRVFATAHEVGLEIVARRGPRADPHRPDMWSALAIVASDLPVPGIDQHMARTKYEAS